MHTGDEATMGAVDKKGGGGVRQEKLKMTLNLRCGSLLTCPTYWIARGGGEDLRGKVLKGHDLSMVLHNGL